MNWNELKTKLTRKHNAPPRPVRHLARLAFIAFLLTFVISRVCVILIMTRRMPNLFFHAAGTHVHHLNYGIFLLSVTTAVLLFSPSPSYRWHPAGPVSGSGDVVRRVRPRA